MSACPTGANRLRVAKIKKTSYETPHVKTIVFADKVCRKAVPGQFIMLWIPGLDEIPMSVAGTYPYGAFISAENVGQSTEALHQFKIGDPIGIRGPFGNGFRLMKKGSALIVGGGTGLIPLTFLGEELAKIHVKMTFVVGAKTKTELLFQKRIKLLTQKFRGKLVTTTDDGTCGIECMATDAAEEILAKEKFSMAYTCGPEPMMHKMFSLAEQHNLLLQASLERLMRCAIGICGSCMLGGFRVCADGPVFTEKQLRTIKGEFGRFKLDFNGRKSRI